MAHINKGFTLIELMIVLVIVAIGVALAVPAYQDVVQRRETTAQAEELSAFINFAQSEAVKYNQMISVHLDYTDANNWCIGANEGSAACDCKETSIIAANYCSLNDVTQIITSATQTKSSMSVASADTTMVFDPVRGTMATADLGTNHGMTLQSDNGNWSVVVDIGITGRVRICNPVPAKAIPGYQACL
ncbi:MAG: GspH/FimT family pseudopilin [Lysobacterales bacterium]